MASNLSVVRPVQQIGDSYLRERVLSASKPELTLMSYDGILRFLGKAQELALDNSLVYQQKIIAIAELNEMIARAQALISDLNTSLDLEAGSGDQEREQVKALGENLRAQYLYLNHHLSMALSRHPLLGLCASAS